MKRLLQPWESEGPLLDMEGQHKLRLENYQDIVELGETGIRLTAGTLQYQIHGEGLWIRAVSKRELFLEGTICGIEIREQGGSR